AGLAAGLAAAVALAAGLAAGLAAVVALAAGLAAGLVARRSRALAAASRTLPTPWASLRLSWASRLSC
ncbi:hypothetical protein EFJ98_27365, partial [Pseudomonas putida]